MASFETGGKYTFHVDGKPYMLPMATFGDAEELQGALKSARDGGLGVIRAVFEKRADKRTLAVIDKLTFPQVGALFREWAGATVGESQPSAD